MVLVVTVDDALRCLAVFMFSGVDAGVGGMIGEAVRPPKGRKGKELPMLERWEMGLMVAPKFFIESSGFEAGCWEVGGVGFCMVADEDIFVRSVEEPAAAKATRLGTLLLLALDLWLSTLRSRLREPVRRRPPKRLRTLSSVWVSFVAGPEGGVLVVLSPASELVSLMTASSSSGVSGRETS